MSYLKPYIFVQLLSLLLVACGQTGDLYLPEDEPVRPVEQKAADKDLKKASEE